MNLSSDLKKALGLINSLTPDLQGRFYTVNYVLESSDADGDALFESLCRLDEIGFIRFDSHNYSFALCEPGRNYREYAGIASREFWRKSVLTPVFVSLATTLITGAIQSWWPQIQEWVSKFLS